jgi:site-specific DNA-cytosine methylase
MRGGDDSTQDVACSVQDGKKSASSYNAVDIFSGVGGAFLGMRQAGFNFLCVNAANDSSLKIFKRNLECCDINMTRGLAISSFLGIKRRDIPVKNIESEGHLSSLTKELSFILAGLESEIDLMVGEACSVLIPHVCESFYERRFVARSEHVCQAFFSILNMLRPKVYLLTTPMSRKQMIGVKRYKIDSDFKRELRDIGYNISSSFILNYSDYGVPQDVFCFVALCVKKDVSIVGDLRKELSCESVRLGDVLLSGKLYDNEVTYKGDEYTDGWASLNIKDIRTGRVDNGFMGYHILSYEEVYPDFLKFADKYCHPVENRRLTMPEYKRIQTIPDDWIVSSLHGESSLVMCALPVSFMKKLGEAIKDCLDGAFLQ